MCVVFVGFGGTGMRIECREHRQMLRGQSKQDRDKPNVDEKSSRKMMLTECGSVGRPV